MKSRLLAPVHDRRRRRRILTLKNFGIFAGLFVLFFAGVSVYNEIGRKSKAEGDYGRLYGRQIQPAVPTQPNHEIVQESPISDEISADPMLIATAIREQYLGTHNQTAAMFPVTGTEPQDFVKPAPIIGQHGERLAIVGDSRGVGIVVEPQQRPTLSGGIFKE